MRIFLSGPMGSGKSTVGALLGERTGLAVIDLDAEIERQSGRSVSEIFGEVGERAFRRLEARTLASVLDAHPDCVLSLGGGTVLSRESRHRLLRSGVLVTLDAPIDVLVARVGRGEGRPLLGEDADVAVRIAELREARAEAYAECHGRVDTGAMSAAQAADAVLALSQRRAIAVPLGRRSYLAEVGAGVRAHVMQRARGASSVVLVTDGVVDRLHAGPIGDALVAAGMRVTKVVLEPGEQAKHIGSVQEIWQRALDAGVDRRALVIGVGGGVVGDLAGFAAATLLRGMGVGHVPTTLLSMVDSSIGGKTGFDTRQGKNLVGAFHQPRFVLADVEVLATLPKAERIAGLAEVVKSAWIEGEAEVAQLERDADALLAGDPAATERAIFMSCTMKARVVTEDEREAGVRALLNLGHSIGHAIEGAKGYAGIRHGEAVALGMVAACRVACARGQQRASDAERLQRLLCRLGLPTDLDAHLQPEVADYLARDKKMDGATIGFVLPSGPGGVKVAPLALPEVLSAVFGHG